MTYRLLLWCLFFLYAFIANAQPGNVKFAGFADRQDSLFVAAYEQKDVATYQSLLADFLSEYSKLNKSDRNTFNSYLIDAYYNLSCTYALLGNKELAIDYLGKSIQTGYTNYSHILEDTDLDTIRNEMEFKKLIEPLRETGDYLYILKKADRYNSAETRELPGFTYQASDTPDLVELRNAFNLDSIAGAGNDVSKIINLMRWVHNLTQHDGSKGNPAVKNALSMIEECKRDGRTLNCRGMAILLNEVYLAEGFKSRYVTCLPKDSLGTDQDCHVINMVYVNSLKKWVWMDPTFEAFVMNENGELLGLGDVRERLIRGQPLVLNPDANWNHKVSQTREHYLNYYMAKNLYRLECPANSVYNLETDEPGKTVTYIQLIPLEYFKQKPVVEQKKYNQNKLVTWKTNNAAVFWQAPL